MNEATPNPTRRSRLEMERAFGSLTEETPAPGLRILQPKRGYRWGVEVYALVGFALGIGAPTPVVRPKSAIELGTGSGVVAFLLGREGVAVRAWDRDPAWIDLARLSLSRSPAATGAVRLSVRDVRALGRVGGADVVVCNPPWFDASAGPVAPDPRRAEARSMLHGTVQDFVDAALRLAPRVCLVTRAERLEELRFPGAHVARRSWFPSGGVGLVELRKGEGTTVEEPLELEAIYAELRAPWRGVRTR